MDFQVNKVYAWENKVVSPYDSNIVPFDSLQMIVDYIWNDMNLKHTPKLEYLPKNNKKMWACANRNNIWAPEIGIPTWVLLHELSHCLTSTNHEGSNLHGPLFVGMYMKLLEKYMNLPILVLMFTANRDGVQFDLKAKPVFLD